MLHKFKLLPLTVILTNSISLIKKGSPQMNSVMYRLQLGSVGNRLDVKL